MAFGLLTTGFNRKRLVDIKTEIEDSLKLTLGQNINLLPSSVLSQLTGIFADRESDLWELLEEVYNSAYPDSASGLSLDNVAAITGIRRLEATYSTVTVTATGTVGTTIPAGTVFSVSGSPTSTFETLAEATIGGGGTVDIDCQAQSTGEIPAPVGTLTVIDTPVAGLDSVTNASEALVGRDEETDTELRIRREEELQSAGNSTVEAIRAKLTALEGVTQAIVFENTTSSVNGDGLPAKSFKAFVQGGDDADIFEAIWQSKPAGIQVVGDESGTVTDSQGLTHTMYFSRPTQVNIYVAIEVTTDSDFPADGAAQVKTAIAGYFDDLEIGDDVIVYPKLLSTINGIPGIIDVRLGVSTVTNPPNLTGSDSNITVAASAVAAINNATTDITVTVI